MAKPLTPLMGKPKEFIWGSAAQESFEKLKKALVSHPILVHFSLEGELELRTDASSYAIGAVLYQKHPDPALTGVVLYFSKTLEKSQRNYTATGRELLAVYTAMTSLSHYLYGKRFTLITDHSALSMLRSNNDPHRKLARWIAELQEFDFVVVHKSGKLNIDADFMSRIDPPEDIDNNTCIYQITSTPIELENMLKTNKIDLQNEQSLDEFCSDIINTLKAREQISPNQARIRANYSLQNDLLYKVNRNNEYLLVIPKTKVSTVLISGHDVPLAGHLGFSRTYGIIRQRYYWKNMRKDIKKYVATCDTCQRRKFRNTRQHGFIQP